MDYCQELVAQGDKDRYLATLYAPPDARPRLFALYAFDIEISRVPQAVSEPMIGEIRLQWWRDSITAIYAAEPQDHPVSRALATAIHDARLPRHAFDDMIEARSAELISEPSDVELHLGKTCSMPIQIACLILGQTCPEAAGLAGVAYGLARMPNAPHADLARRRLAEARACPMPREALPAFLHVSLAESYLASKGRALSLWRRQWTIWRAARAERF
jgi:phytoene/squalene synthetase